MTKRKTPSSKERIIRAFLNDEWMTDAKAIYELGTHRFHPTKAELEDKGWIFHSEWVEGYNRYGKLTRWKRYRLIKRGK